MAEWYVAMRSWVSQTSRFPPASVSEEEAESMATMWKSCRKFMFKCGERLLWLVFYWQNIWLHFKRISKYRLKCLVPLPCVLVSFLCFALNPQRRKSSIAMVQKDANRTWADSLIPKDGWLWMNSLLNDAMLKVRTCPLYKMFYDFEWCEFARSCWHNYKCTKIKINKKKWTGKVILWYFGLIKNWFKISCLPRWCAPDWEKHTNPFAWWTNETK